MCTRSEYVTTSNSVFNFNKIAGKRSSAEVKQLQMDDKEITSVTDIADTLSETLSEISSTSPYSETFQLHKARAEHQTLKFNSNNTETYNTPFSMNELLDSLSKSSDTAVARMILTIRC